MASSNSGFANSRAACSRSKVSGSHKILTTVRAMTISEPVENLSTGRNSMQPIPQEIRTLIERCEVNEVRFDNDDMSTALTYAEALRIENKRLCEALKRARELARKDCLSMREFAREIGVTPTQLSAWTDEIPNREPDFKD